MDVIKQKIITSKLDIKDCIIINTPPKDLNLSDIVIGYNTGESRWKIIKLDDMKKFCILYDRFYKKENENKEHIFTLIFNPITLNICTFSGKIEIDDINEDGSFILKKDIYKFKFGTKESLDSQIDNIHIERKETKIMELKNMFMFASDPKYIIIKKKSDNILNDKYYKNKKDFLGNNLEKNYHPKSLVYIIQYLSKKGMYKTTILVGTKINYENPTGFNFKESKFEDYFKIYKDKLQNKKAFIFPMFLYYAKLIFNNAKIIFL